MDDSTTTANTTKVSPDPETFKGVLLSNRPQSVLTTSGRASNKSAQKSDDDGQHKPPFLSPGAWQMTPLGLCPSREEQGAHYIAKAVRDERVAIEQTNFIEKHRQYVKGLGESKRDERVAALEEALERDKQTRRFQEEQAELRKILREKTGSTLRPAESETGLYHDTQRVTKSLSATESEAELSSLLNTMGKTLREVVAEIGTTTASDKDKTSSLSDSTVKQHKKSKRKQKEKPQWALSEEKRQQQEDKEVDDLLAFANDVDFEKYVTDLEVREALGVIKSKVDEMQTELRKKDAQDSEEDSDNEEAEGQDSDEDKNDDTVSVADSDTSQMSENTRLKRREAREKRRRAKESSQSSATKDQPGWNNSTKLDDESNAKALKTQLGEAAMLATPDLAKIHSKASLGSVALQRAKAAGTQTEEDVLASTREDVKAKILQESVPIQLVKHGGAESIMAQIGHKTVRIEEPDPVVHDRILTKLKKSTDYVQNLPYMYRSPSI